MNRSLPPRSEVEKRFTWNAESVFEDEAGWEKALDTILSRLPDLQEVKGHLGDSPDLLAGWVDASERVHRVMAPLIVYSIMAYSCDVGAQEAAARADRARSVAAQLGAAGSFAGPEMLSLGIPELR